MREAGFDPVEVMEEKEFPVKLMANDPTGKAAMESMDINEVDASEVGKSISSVSVFARKPE
jgi:hypothetical protein